MKTCSFSYSCHPEDFPIVFSFSILKPKKETMDLFFIYEEKKILIAQFTPKEQKMFSFEDERFRFDVDTLTIKVNHKVTFTVEVIGDQEALKKGCSVNLSIKGQEEDQKDCLLSIPKKLIPQFSLDHQDAHRICQPCTLFHLLAYLKEETVSLDQVLNLTYDSYHKIYGNWSLMTYAFYNLVEASYILLPCFFSSFYQMGYHLNRSMPVICSIQGALDGAMKPFLSGHLILVIGMDDQGVYCLDSAEKKIEAVSKKYRKEAFKDVWKNRNHLGFIFKKKS